MMNDAEREKKLEDIKAHAEALYERYPQYPEKQDEAGRAWVADQVGQLAAKMHELEQDQQTDK